MDRLLSPDDQALARKVARATLVTRLFILAAIVVGLAVLVVQLQLASDTNDIANKVSDKQNSNAPLLASIENLALEIRSCTNPEGECSKRNQANQAKALGLIKADTRDVVAASLTCQQRGVTGFENITACVDRLLLDRAPRRR